MHRAKETMNRFFRALCTILIVPGFWLATVTSAAAQQPEIDLTRNQVEEIVRRSAQGGKLTRAEMQWLLS